MSIKILTYNTAFLPSATALDNTDAELRKRGNDFAEKLKESGCDIICLQEVFNEDIRKIITDRLRDIYPYRVEKATKYPILPPEDSGLYFASKYPFKKDKRWRKGWIFEMYSGLQNWDASSEKGYLGCNIVIAEYKQFHIFNTHLQSAYPGLKYEEVRTANLTELKREIVNKLHLLSLPKLHNTSCLACGDFNIIGYPDVNNSTADEYNNMLRTLDAPRDLYYEQHYDLGLTWNGLENIFIQNHYQNDTDELRLDYMFAFDHIPRPNSTDGKVHLDKIICKKINVVKFKNQNGVDLSDHYGLEAEIDFEASDNT
jgi:endonuclease/exonuclease/phosphatase family metal-dependent hydrolase